MRVATLGQVAAGPAEIDGVAVAADPELPLAEGDRITVYGQDDARPDV